MGCFRQHTVTIIRLKYRQVTLTKMILSVLLVATCGFIPALALPPFNRDIAYGGYNIPVSSFQVKVKADSLDDQSIQSEADLSDESAEKEQVQTEIKSLEDMIELAAADSEDEGSVEKVTSSEESSSEETDESLEQRDKRWARVVGTGIKKTYRGTKKGVGMVWRGTKTGLKKTWHGIKVFSDKTDKYMWPLLFMEIPGDTRMPELEHDEDYAYEEAP